ncbi:hypothetical protein [Paractinoplanes brasiliensis]|uniref:Uncharacterized protein n=1 Tax=Paractinoplanes brasiliensis TaxID=52695 RepID=A0A4V3C7N9_9ACTN|nr:hypothetical protein [Actinoplanes brasiliensis]TDO38388.1 hypothetical protein C8E87_2041 [Actinoplanes brasiliensis]GID26836.1 hypothetical protein Abr02nite_18190 [Actinoplanes brasiliensis]
MTYQKKLADPHVSAIRAALAAGPSTTLNRPCYDARKWRLAAVAASPRTGRKEAAR